MRMRTNLKRLKSFVWSGKPILITVLAIIFAAGILSGYFFALRFSAETGSELRHYFSAFRAMYTGDELSASVVLHTILAYFRTPVCVFLLGFASVGVLLIPAVCFCQGFIFSFTLFCYLSAMGRGFFWLILAMFSIRFLVVLPCTLYLSTMTFHNARLLALYSLGKGKRVQPVRYSGAYFLAFGVCCILLMLGSLLELFLVPRIVMLPI